VSHLNDNQRRRLFVALSELEGILHELTRLLQAGGEKAGVLVREHTDIPEQAQVEVEALITRARAQLEAMSRASGLRPTDRSRRRAAMALALAGVVLLEDTEARSFAGYGPVTPELVAFLDPPLRRLRHEFEGMVRLLSNEAPGPD
jgi:hypothetical protein